MNTKILICKNIILLITLALIIILTINCGDAKMSLDTSVSSNISSTDSNNETEILDSFLSENSSEELIVKNIYPLETVQVKNDILKHIKFCQEELAAADTSWDETSLEAAIVFYEEQWVLQTQEYEVMAQVWRYLTEECQYSEAIVAGILGNMMRECGGSQYGNNQVDTFELQWWCLNKKSNCYGLCQWNPKYHTIKKGASLEEQLEYIEINFPQVLSDKWNLNQYSPIDSYEEFLALTEPAEVAKAFYFLYENPGSSKKSYNSKRGNNAIAVYDYFMGETE